MKTHRYGNASSGTVLVQMIDVRDLESMDGEAACIAELAGTRDFLLVAVEAENWNRDLSPWEAPPVFGEEGFGNGAAETLARLAEEALRPLAAARPGRTFFLGGYSLAGLFALWAGYNSSLFAGIAAASPSAWFPGFQEYTAEHRMCAGAVYLSLGKKEEKTRNPTMAQVAKAIRAIHGNLESCGADTVLEWNEGNHFQDPDVRMAKGFAWLLRQAAKSVGR